jgi:hypothetical protein
MQKRRIASHGNGTRTNRAKARGEPKLGFTSLVHHITKKSVWENCEIRTDSAPGVDRQTVTEAKENFGILD